MTIQLPERLKQRGIRFVLLERQGKKPFQQSWQNKIVEFDCPELLNHLQNGGNYGVLGGGEKKLILVDFDNEQIEKELIKKLPETFTVKTGSGRLHLYYISNECKSFKIFDEDLNTLCDVQGDGKQVVGANSIHPNGNKYELIKDIDLAYIDYSELKANIIPYDKKPKKELPKEEPKQKPSEDNDFISTLKSYVKIPDLLRDLGIDTSRNPTECPFHSSKGGKCLGFKDETAHCFHCEESWNIFSLVKKAKDFTSKEAIEYLAKLGNLETELEESRKKYFENLKKEELDEKKKIRWQFLSLISGKEKDWAAATELLVDYIKDKLRIYTTKEDKQSEMWVYKEGIYVPQGKSEIKELLRDLLEENYSMFVFNKVVEKIEPDTYINSNEFFNKTYIEEIPLENGILNIFNLELKPYDPEKVFFHKLPVKFNISATCPQIDEFLKGILSDEEDIKVFYEIAGFSLLKEYRFEKAFMFIGNGRNGKDKSLELIKRLIGVENCSSIPLASLLPENFCISELHGKLVNIAGDVGNQDLKDTSMFKALTGRSLISGKRKFLNNVIFTNYAKFIFACNELPMVYDMSKGFWDRWTLLEFPYTFVPEHEYNLAEDKTKLKIRDENIITKIINPEEMSGFLNQSLLGLARLINGRTFSTTKGSEEVKNTWIRKSNSFIAFCFDMLEEDYDSRISKKDLRKVYHKYCKQHKVAPKTDYVVKRVLQEMFGVVEERVSNQLWNNEWVWTGINFKDNSKGVLK